MVFAEKKINQQTEFLTSNHLQHWFLRSFVCHAFDVRSSRVFYPVSLSDRQKMDDHISNSTLMWIYLGFKHFIRISLNSRYNNDRLFHNVCDRCSCLWLFRRKGFLPVSHFRRNKFHTVLRPLRYVPGSFNVVHKTKQEGGGFCQELHFPDSSDNDDLQSRSHSKRISYFASRRDLSRSWNLR